MTLSPMTREAAILNFSTLAEIAVEAAEAGLDEGSIQGMIEGWIVSTEEGSKREVARWALSAKRCHALATTSVLS